MDATTNDPAYWDPVRQNVKQWSVPPAPYLEREPTHWPPLNRQDQAGVAPSAMGHNVHNDSYMGIMNDQMNGGAAAQEIAHPADNFTNLVQLKCMCGKHLRVVMCKKPGNLQGHQAGVCDDGGCQVFIADLDVGNERCRCGLPTTEFTCKKQGPNFMRRFMACSARACNKFRWAQVVQNKNN